MNLFAQQNRKLVSDLARERPQANHGRGGRNGNSVPALLRWKEKRVQEQSSGPAWKRERQKASGLTPNPHHLPSDVISPHHLDGFSPYLILPPCMGLSPRLF